MIARDSGYYEAEAAGLRALGSIEVSQGRYDEAREHLLQALELFQRMNNRFELGQVTVNLGILNTALEEHGKALEFYLQGLAYARDSGKPKHWLTEPLCRVGLAYLDLGEPEKALDYLEQARAVLPESERVDQKMRVY
ncbi:MAG: tetratricopeptide repeat protein [Acidobacteria bacterium]|nr:tetratricopeptide repeat protein [Acidobacteriota bacterium]